MIRNLAMTVFLLALVLTAAACGGTPPQPGPALVTEQAPPPPQPTAAYPAPEVVQATPSAPPVEQPYPAPTQMAVEPVTPAATVEPVATVTPGVSDIAALVNGQPISMAEYQRELTRARAFFISQGMADPNTEEGREFLAQVGRQLLEQQLITDVLMEQAAQRLGITVSDEEVQAAVEAAFKDMGGEQALQDLLASQGMTREEFLKQQRTLLLAQALQEQVIGQIGSTAEQVHARLIFVKTEAEAQKAMARVRAGEDFAKVAREMSQAASSAESGGDLGWFPRGIMPPELDAVAFTLEPGQISHIIPTADGYNILQILERDPNRPLSEEQVQTLLAQASEKFQAWLEAERAKADVKIFVEQ